MVSSLLLLLTTIAQLLYKISASEQYYDSYQSNYPSQYSSECQNGALQGNPSDCTTYLQCVNGRFELKLCPYGQNFDPISKCCRRDYVCPSMQEIVRVDAHNIEIPLTTPPPPPPPPPEQPINECNYGDRRVDYSDCKKYFSCVGEQKRFERRFCPQGQYFNERLNRCVAGDCQNGLIFGEESDLDGPCQESSGRRGYRADREDCRKFYQCAQGKWVHKDCPSNLVWNPRALVCDWPQSGQQC